MRKIAGRRASISVLRSCHGFQVKNGVHPFDGTGLLPVIAQPPDCCWTRRAGILGPRVKSHATRARTRSATNVMLFEQSLVARLVLALDVIEQGAAGGDHLQQAAA